MINAFFERANTIWYGRIDLSADKVKAFYQLMGHVIDYLKGILGEHRPLPDPGQDTDLERLLQDIANIPPRRLIVNQSGNPTFVAGGSEAGRGTPAARGGGRGTGRGAARGGGAGRGAGRGAANNPPQRNIDLPLLPSTRGYEKDTDQEDPLQNLDDPCFELLKNALFQGTSFFFLKKPGAFFRSLDGDGDEKLYKIRSNPVPQITNPKSTQFVKSYVIEWEPDVVSIAYEDYEPNQLYNFLGDIFLKLSTQ